MNQTTKRAGLSALALATGTLLYLSVFLNRAISPIAFTIIIATGLQSMAAFLGLGWALKRQSNAFLSIFVGDSLLRLVGLGVAVYYMWSRSIPYSGTLITLGMSYLLLSLTQIPFFYRAR